MSRKLTARGEQRRRELLAYATRAFASEGFHKTSVSQIVAGLGVGKGVFYWYFDSKEQLFLEILREAQTDLRRKQQQAIVDERSAEHTSELQSLMRISYAVFCLKKKNADTTTLIYSQNIR